MLSLDPNALVADFIGRPLVYNGVDLTNIHGVVVSSGDMMALLKFTESCVVD
jgi:hypothetical protein